MNTSPLSKGGKKLYAYRVDDTGSAYALVQNDGTTAATTLAHAALTLTLLEDLQDARQDSGSWKLTPGHYNLSPELSAFVKSYCTPSAENAASGLPEITFIDGEKLTAEAAAAASGALFLIVAYGPFDGGIGKRLVPVALCTAAVTSGSRTISGKDYTKTGIEFNSIKTAYALEIPTAMFDTDFVDAPATPQTLAEGLYGDDLWLAFTP